MELNIVIQYLCSVFIYTCLFVYFIFILEYIYIFFFFGISTNFRNVNQTNNCYLPTIKKQFIHLIKS